MNTNKRKVLVLVKGGSHSYGLETPASDIDYRGVFVNTDVGHLIGLQKDEQLVTQNAQEDKVFSEFRHALKLLRNANTQMIELLYMKEFELVSPEWGKAIDLRKKLLSSEKLFNSLRGYMQGELRLANGERTGKLGGKRKETIDKYGFSPKNFVQLFRLSWAGMVYFRRGYFPVNVGDENLEYRNQLFDIKTHPEKYSVAELNDMAAHANENLVAAYANRNHNSIFDEDVANQLCLSVYGPLVAAL
jgi:predicted nucleotidyltransferase